MHEIQLNEFSEKYTCTEKIYDIMLNWTIL